MNLQHYPERIQTGFGLAAALVLAGLITVTLAFGRGEFDEGYELDAIFPTSSQGLFTDGASAVKLRGVNIGEVNGIELLPDGRARVSLFIHDGIAVPDTAMASIEPLSVFGPKFVRLEPGAHESSGPFLGEGDRIAHTRTQRELTDILASTTRLFDAIDPLDIIVTVDAIAEGTAGMGRHIGDTIDASGVLAAVAAEHADDIRQFLRDVAALTGTFAQHGDDILTIGGNVESIVDATLRDPDRLDRLLDATTGISTTFATLLRDNGDELDVTLRAVGSFIDQLSVESDRIPDFIDMLGTFFGRLADVIRMDGPNGTRMTALRGFISLDLCLVYGICLPGSEAGATRSAGATSTASADVVDARALRAMDDARPAEGPLMDLAHLLIGGAR